MPLKPPSTIIERRLLSERYKIIAGIDEVGRGAWAGPLVAAACVLNVSESGIINPPAGEAGQELRKTKIKKIYRVRDSKLLTSDSRAKLARVIKKKVLSWSIGEVSVKELTNLGLTKALECAYKRAIESLDVNPDMAIIDGSAHCYILPCFYQSIVQGDSLCLSIACASIIAKDYRDRLMRNLAKEFRGYGFEKHKGYGTKYHQEQLAKYGLSEIHRQNFKSIKNFV